MTVDMSKHFSMCALLRFTLPTIAMTIFTSIYGVVDGVFVSNFAGKTAFASVNLIMPFIMILSIVGLMIGTGGSAIVAKTRGEGDNRRANSYFSLLVYTTFILGTILAILGWFGMPAMAQILGAQGEMVDYCVLYGRLLMLSLPFYSLQYAFQAFFVTAGKPNLGFLVIVAAGGANIILDALFVGFLGWGVPGAAFATNISEIIAGGLPLIYFFRNNTSFLKLGRTRLRWRIIGKACTNGSSEMVANISISIVSMLYNFQLMHYLGEDGVAAYGVIMYTGMVFGAIFMGYNMGSAPLLSFQFGARNRTEMRSIMWKSIGFVWICGLIMLLAGQVLAAPFSYLFTGYDPELYETTVHGYKLFALSFLFMGFSMYGSAFFTALNNGGISALISFLRTLVLETSSVLLLPLLLGVNGIWLSVTVAEIACVIITSAFMVGFGYRYGYRLTPEERKQRRLSRKA